MSELIDKYQFEEIRFIDNDVLLDLVADELQCLYLDFSQKIDTTQIPHETKRVVRELQKNFKTWHFGDVHTAFQLMLDRSIYSYSKVTVRGLFNCLNTARELKRKRESRTGGEFQKVEYASEDRKKFAQAGAYWGPYLRWWLQYNVDPKQVDVAMYNEAKENNQLQALTNKWKNTRQSEQGITFVRNINKPQRLKDIV